MRRRRDSNPVSLFPFLAVLVSAMGSLILLLIVITRQAQETRDREFEKSQAIPALPPLPEREKYSPPTPRTIEVPELVHHELPALPELVDPRAKIQSEIAQRRAEIAAAKSLKPSSPSEAETRLAELLQQVDDLERHLAELIRRQREKDLEQKKVRDELANIERQRIDVRGKNVLSSDLYSIVPYDGPTGTHRRPIYLECRRDRIILQPEGIELGPDAIGDAANPSNALAQLVRTVLRAQRLRGEVPYPLLVVRPDGIAAFYVARSALSTLGSDYGYELVDDSMNLAYGKPDPQMKDLAAAILRDAQGRSPLVASAGSRRDFVLDPIGGSPRDERGAFESRRQGTSGWKKDRSLVGGGETSADELPRFTPSAEGLAAMPWQGAGGAPARPPAATIASATHEAGIAGGQPSGKEPDLAASGEGEDDGPSRPPARLSAPIAVGDPRTGQVATGASSLPKREPSARDAHGAASDPSSSAGDADPRLNLASRPSLGSSQGGKAQSSRTSSPGRNPESSPSNAGAESAYTLSEFEQLLAELSQGESGAMTGQPPSSTRVQSTSSSSAGSAVGTPSLLPDDSGTIRTTRTRVISVECRQDGLRVTASGVMIPFDEGIEAARSSLLRHVAEQVVAWGRPNAADQWLPIVEFQVRPDGLESYYDLRLMLAGCGVTVRHRLVGWTEPLAFEEL